MFEIVLFTTQRFDTRAKAKKVLKFLNENGGPFVPVKFGATEPVRQPFDPAEMSQAVDLLAGSPEHTWGRIMLKGNQFKSLIWIRWSETTAFQTWHLFLNPAFFEKKGATKQLLDFLTKLLDTVPVVFGTAGSEEEWKAKHYLVTKLKTGSSTEKLGTDPDKCLPGVYWATIFGKELTEFFGKERLLSLPVEQALDLGASGTALVVSENPFDDTAQLLEREGKLVEALGSEHFFDIREPNKDCAAMAQVLAKYSVGKSEEGK